jgi:LPXTG-motif cell wall-anchored protein
MKHLLWVVGLVALGPAIWFIYQFNRLPDVDTAGHTGQSTSYLIYAGIFFAVALICFAVFFFLRFKEEGEQDISITKF